MQNKIMVVGDLSAYKDVICARIAAVTPKQNNQLAAPTQSGTGGCEGGIGESGQQGDGASDGSEDDGDGGDSDEDGPRHRPSYYPPNLYSSARARQLPVWRQFHPYSASHAPHRCALATLVLLTLTLLAAALAFGLAGHEWLAGQAMTMACGLPRLASALVKPK